MKEQANTTVSHFVNDPKPVPYTLRIGVTGHRNLANPDAVAEAVEQSLIKIKRALERGVIDPHQPKTARQTKWQCLESHFAWKVKQTLASLKIVPRETALDRRTPLYWQVISSLAKGADRIVARAAIDKLDAILEAVFPFPVDKYKEDFKHPDDLGEFNGLFEKATNYQALHDPSFNTMSACEEGYELAGKDVVDSCEILIAVWNGQPARGKGGTAEIVEYACSIKRLVLWINADDPSSLPRILSEVEKVRDKIDISIVKSIRTVTRPLPKIASGWSSRFMQVVEYNRDSAFKQRGFDVVFDRNWTFLEMTRVKTNLIPEYLHPTLNFLLPHYSRADFLAICYQKLHIRAATWLYRLAAFSVTIAVLQVLFIPDQTEWIAFEIIALIGAVVWFRLSLLENWHEKWLDYRHLAERLRMLSFTSLMGYTPASSLTLQNQQLPFYPGPGGWVLDVYDKIKQDLPPANIPHDKLNNVRQFILSAWISDQAIYHEGNSNKKAHNAMKDHKRIGVMLAVIIVAATMHLLKLVNYQPFEYFIIALVIILPAFAAAQHAIGGIHDFERIAARSSGMREILLSIEGSIKKADNWEELRKEIQRAEDIMSTENHEWCVSLSFRRIDLPV
ncbi:MAG: hypothetical protein NT004_07860 [Bacteroidetes bacterium]|nr:hypothetical protein [Bacteroidota bacterium]